MSPPALEVVHVDNHLLVVAKPAGLPVVPDASGDESLLDRARAWVEVTYDKPGRAYLGVVHRLDRPVSGLVCFARTSKAAARLTEAFRERRVEKVYLGLAEGVPRGEGGEVVQWVEKDARTGRVAAAPRPVPGAREARTRWRLVGTGRLEGEGPARAVALLRLEPLTGRAHQLRLAAASLGTPLVGDLRHGAPRPLSDRSVALHAFRLAFEHPTRRERVAFTLPPPPRAWWRAVPPPDAP